MKIASASFPAEKSSISQLKAKPKEYRKFLNQRQVSIIQSLGIGSGNCKKTQSVELPPLDFSPSQQSRLLYKKNLTRICKIKTMRSAAWPYLTCE